MIKLALCDDSQETINRTEHMIEELKISDLEYDSFYSGEELLEHLEMDGEEYDIFILDIEMGRINGLELAKELRTKYKDVIIIFCTSHNEFIYEAFEVLAFNYIDKPLTIEKMQKVLDKSISFIEASNKKFSFRYKNKEKMINCNDILYFESEKRKMYVHMVNGEEYSFYDTVSNTLKSLEKNVFVQTNVSYIVSMRYIDEISREHVLLKDKSKIPVSNKYRDNLKENYHVYLRRKAL